MSTTNITLNDIAGYKEEKAELTKIIKLLTNYKKYAKAGIYVPKGLVLQGPPGCGKTLMAKAIATECKVPFLAFQADSDAATSLKKLQALFEQAKQKVPAIVYIDEIDKLTSHRFFDSDAVRTMVQYLLTELDGLQNTQGIMVIASTNFYDSLPDSLVRSGRIDKKIFVGFPDLESRIEMLELYTKNYPIFSDVNLKSLALKLTGMSGADIKTLINNALIEYIDTDKKVVVEDFVDLINQMNFEDIGRRWGSKEIVKKVLVHEAGHAIVNYMLTGKPSSISGVQYGGAAGHTRFDEDLFAEDVEDIDIEVIGEELEDRNITKQDILNEIAALFGGMMAEEAFYGSFDSGAVSDIMNATRAVNRMANFYFLDSRFIDIDIERLKDARTVQAFLRARDRIFKKERRICRSIIKHNKYLIRYIVDKAINNEDTLNSTQLKAAITEYFDNKKAIIKNYKTAPFSLRAK